jgi:PAS domain S-box-containing protein
MNKSLEDRGKWTERPSAIEGSMSQNQSMFELYFERSADAIWLYDPKAGVFADCNQAAVELMRAGSRERLLQMRPAELSPPRQPDGTTSEDKAAEVSALAGKIGGHRFEWIARRCDGEDIPLEVLATPISIDGQTMHVIVSRDVTERKKGEAALIESQQLLASVADNISEAVYRTGPNHELIFANRAYLRLSGYNSVAEMQRIPREKLYARPSDRMQLLDGLAKGGFRNLEVEFVRADGHRWWGLCNGVAVRDTKTGAVLYHVGSVADITERKRAEEEILKLNASLERRIAARTAELTASEERLRTLVEHAPEAIVVFDGDTGQFLFGNTHACAIYGRLPEELTQLTPAQVSPEFQPDGRRSADLAREKVQEALQGGMSVFEWMHQQPGGRLVPTEVRLIRLPSEGKNLIRASIIDNSVRKRRERIQEATHRISEAVHTTCDLEEFFRQIHEIVKGLMPAENLYIALLDASRKMITFPYVVDENKWCNVSMPIDKGLTGYVLKTGNTLLAGPHNAAAVEGVIDAVLDGSQKVVAVPCGHSAAVWLGAPLTTRGDTFGVIAVQDYHKPAAYGDEEKQLLTFVAGQVALAIERKRAEEALRESEEKFRALFEASSAGVMLHDDKEYLEVNPAAARILGYHRPEELKGKHPRDTSPPFQPNGESSAVLAARHIDECMNRGHARFEWLSRHALGHEVPVEVILTRIEWGGRHVIQALVTDITERKKAEAELLKSLAREKELGQLKSNFVSMVSHEFRTPLGVIMSSAEILENYLEQLEPGDRREQLQSIQKNTRRMAGLMEEVLLLGMVEAGKMDFKPAPANLPAFCRHLIDELHSATDSKCPVDFNCGTIPEESYADKRLLRHIFSNLLSNAAKYSPVKSRIAFTIEREGLEAICRVRDQGLGIPEEDLKWLFNAFHRGRNVGHMPGTGLGLTIVKRCVELHQGKIEIQSSVNHGTTVTVRLPLFREPNPEIN